MKQVAKDAVKVFPTDDKLHLEIGNAFGKAEALKVFSMFYSLKQHGSKKLNVFENNCLCVVLNIRPQDRILTVKNNQQSTNEKPNFYQR